MWKRIYKICLLLAVMGYVFYFLEHGSNLESDSSHGEVVRQKDEALIWKPFMEEMIKTRNCGGWRAESILQRFPRHYFVPNIFGVAPAYTGDAIQISENRKLISCGSAGSYLETLMKLHPQKILILGGGTGYVAALSSSLCEMVSVVDSDEARAHEIILSASRLGIENLELRISPERIGWLEASPFDVILINSKDPGIEPSFLHAQLSAEGKILSMLNESNN
jgi:protein-L-isoaspartate O-methyltransferase